MGDEFTKNESGNAYALPDAQMKAVIKVKFCNTRLQLDGVQKTGSDKVDGAEMCCSCEICFVDG